MCDKSHERAKSTDEFILLTNSVSHHHSVISLHEVRDKCYLKILVHLGNLEYLPLLLSVQTKYEENFHLCTNCMLARNGRTSCVTGSVTQVKTHQRLQLFLLFPTLCMVKYVFLQIFTCIIFHILRQPQSLAGLPE